MASDIEQQELDAALMQESTGVPPKKDSKSKKRNQARPSTVQYIIMYGIPTLIVLLLIVAFIVTFIAIRKYNKNCKHTKAGSCQGIKWFFT